MYDNFDKLLTKHKLKIIDVSRETGIPYSTFTDWKSGRSKPKLDKLRKIAKLFHISVDELTGKEEITSSQYISSEEYMILYAYRDALPYKKEAIKDLLGIQMDVVEDGKKATSGA